MYKKSCNNCNEKIVMLIDKKLDRWTPTEISTYTDGENSFDANVHERHECTERPTFNPNAYDGVD